jgi:hypothetical protein
VGAAPPGREADVLELALTAGMESNGFANDESPAQAGLSSTVTRVGAVGAVVHGTIGWASGVARARADGGASRLGRPRAGARRRERVRPPYRARGEQARRFGRSSRSDHVPRPSCG